jgi:hypothetical protein
MLMYRQPLIKTCLAHRLEQAAELSCHLYHIQHVVNHRTSAQVHCQSCLDPIYAFRHLSFKKPDFQVNSLRLQ